jgi:translation initiation factor 2 subunit 1
MYESKFPQADDLVLVQVKNVAEMGAYVTLLEYDNIEGMILLSELSRRRIRSINRLIRVGRTEVVIVLRVDEEKGYIDLSKRRVSPEDIAKCEERYNKSKAVHSIMRHVSEICKVPLIELYQQFGWDLYKRFGHAYEAFKYVVKEPDEVLGKYNIREDVKKALLANITRRMTPQALKLRADIEVTCFKYAGIEAIRAGIKAAEALSEENMTIKMKLVAPPLFVMMMTALEKDLGIELMNKAIAKIEEVVGSMGGAVTIKQEPRAVTERDDKLLTVLMQELENKNAEKDGDEPTDD